MTASRPAFRVVAWRGDGPRGAAVVLSRAAVLAALVVVAWHRGAGPLLPGVDVPSVPHNYLGGSIRPAEVLAIVAALSLALAGPSRAGRLRGASGVFALSSLALAALAAASSLWALYPVLATIKGLHLLIWTAFALVVARARVSPHHMAIAFVLGLLVHAVVALGQVAIQGPLGLTALGELRNVPEAPWATAAVGFSHVVRAYGLTPHPNVLGGHLAIGLILCWGLAADRRPIGRARAVAALAVLFVVLLFTFSRSALFAALVGTIVAALWQRRAGLLNHAAVRLASGLVAGAAVVFLLFVAVFHEYVAGRIPSPYAPLAERRGLIDAAVQLFVGHPLGGVGAGSFSAATRAASPDRTALDAVHNVPLLIGAELGLAGLSVVGSAAAVLAVVGFHRWRARSAHPWHGLIAGSLTALALAGLFDHYPWSVPQGGLLGAWLAGWWLAADAVNGPHDSAPVRHV